MEIKIKLDSSFFIGLFAGIALSLILAAAALGFVLGTLHLKTLPGNRPSAAGSPQEAPSAEAAPNHPQLPPAAGPADKNVPTQGPPSAPITIQEFADFHCHFCRVAAPTIKQLFEKFPGKIKREFHHFPLSETPGEGSFLTHEWSACAQEQGKFWEFHDGVFGISQAPTLNDLTGIAKNIGLNQAQLDSCLKTGKYREVIKKARAAGTQQGVSGTPTFFVNGQKEAGAFPLDHFVGVVNGILTGTAPPPPPSGGAPQPQAPPPPRANVQFDDLNGRPSRGPENAKVTIVEFSDFHCPFCQRIEPTLEEIEKNFPGQIRRIWRHFPLPMHVGAQKTHEASECAFEQGKFWEYHHKLFETLGQPRDEVSLVNLAGDLKLDKSRFEQCLKSGKYKSRVEQDIAKGSQSGVTGTPAAFVNGQLVEGAQPYSNFEQIVKNKLNGG